MYATIATSFFLNALYNSTLKAMTRTFGFDVTVAQVVTVFRLPRAGVV